jgi:GNAT superfamily N-acetyltransferase
MARRIGRLTLDTLSDLPPHARSCLHWELDPVRRGRVEDDAAAAGEKEAWLSRVLLEWGSCGRVLYVDDQPVGFVEYAPPAYFAGSASYATAPVAEDAVQLATLEVLPEHRGAGYGRLLMQAMVKDLLERGEARAVEAFGSTLPADDCVVPAEFLQRVGFKTQRAHGRNPRLRMELRSVLSWRDEVEAALDRLLGAVRPGRSVGRPAPTLPRGGRVPGWISRGSRRAP